MLKLWRIDVYRLFHSNRDFYVITPLRPLPSFKEYQGENGAKRLSDSTFIFLVYYRTSILEDTY